MSLIQSSRFLLLLLLTGVSTAVSAQTPTPTPDPDINRAVVAQSTFLSYQTVRDNFGKKFADSYFVIQIDVRNEKLNKQFIVQTLDVIIDPNQCRYGQELYAGFNDTECVAIFNSNFVFPNAMQSVRREELLAVGKATQDRSPRNVAFRILGFTANLGSILTGFPGLIGRDGIRGMNVLGTTFTEAAGLLFPDRTGEKLDNLKNATPTEDVVIKSKESKTFSVFIPTDRVFYSESWKKFKRSPSKSDLDTFKLKAVLDILLLSSATGVLVDNNAPTVVVRSDDQLRKQSQKFSLVRTPTIEEMDRNAEFLRVIQDLSQKLVSSTPADVNSATATLRKIKTKLERTKQFKDFLSGAALSDSSTGTAIRDALISLARYLERGNEDALVVAAFEEAVIARGN